MDCPINELYLNSYFYLFLTYLNNQTKQVIKKCTNGSISYSITMDGQKYNYFRDNIEDILKEGLQIAKL